MKSWQKKIKYALSHPVLRIYLSGLLKTSRRSSEGFENIKTLIEEQQPFIPCYWHQQNICCAVFMLDWLKLGFKAGFLISPSRDGEVPAKEFQRRQATVIRGSSSRTGASAMRDLYQVITKDKVCPANTPDGPRGPIYEFKTGPLMLAQMTGAPLVPMAASCDRYWQFNSWDKFILPKWFGRIRMNIGEPVYINKKTAMADLDARAEEMGATLMQLTTNSAKQLDA